MTQDGRAVDDLELERIEHNIYNGMYNDWEIQKLFVTIRIQRKVLREMFNLFTSEPLKLISTGDPIRNSTLRYMKEQTAMEDGR